MPAAARAVPDSLPPFTDAWETFFRAVRHARGRAAKAEDGTLTLPQYHLLEPLERAGALPVGVLAHEAGVAAPTATKMLDGLVRAGLVARAPAARDRRVVLISLTDGGREALAARRDGCRPSAPGSTLSCPSPNAIRPRRCCTAWPR